MAQDLVVFSHIRWDHLHSRPHQLMRRLADSRRIFFFEEPLQQENIEPYLDAEEAFPNLFVCQPHTPEKVPGFHERQLPYLDHLLADLLDAYHVEGWVAWLYTPMAEPLLHDYQPAAVVYDCMADLHRKNTLLPTEADLLEVADLVFTNTPGLQQLLQRQHGQVHCFLDSVERDHFARATRPISDPLEQAQVPHPRIGFYGTIDERLDVNVLAMLSQAHPDWQMLVIGPVVCLDDESNLPQAPNIHYLGPVRYAQLPEFLAGWDLCVLPLALHESSLQFNPAKLLEIMAAECPLVCTALAGLSERFAGAVHFADSAASFVAACEQALQESSQQRQARLERMRDILERTSWEATAHQMQQLLAIVLHKNRQRRRRQQFSSAVTVPAPADSERAAVPRPLHPPPVIVVGAGPTGLSAALELGDQALVLDRNERVGGGCRSLEDHGFIFDYGGQVLCSREPWVQNLYRQLLADNLHWQLPEISVYSNNVHSRYPVQESLYGLSAEVVQACLMGAMNSRLQATAASAEGVAASGQEGSLVSTLPLNSQTLPFRNRRREPRNLEDFILETWGAGIARHFLLPYNEKFWTYPLRELDVSALQGSPVECDLDRIVAGALKPLPASTECALYLGYPLQGGFQALMDGFLPQVQVELNAQVVAVSPSARRLTLADGRRLRYQQLISTLPLLDLIAMAGEEVPPDIRAAVQGLRTVSLRRVNLGVGREHLTDKHWIYYPHDTLFHRVFAQGNASPACNAPGGFGLTCEISYSAAKPLEMSDEALIQCCIKDCIKVGLMRAHDPVWTAGQIDIPDAYPVPDLARAGQVALIRNWLESQDIFPAGRGGEWQCQDCDQAFVAGRQAASRILSVRRALLQAGHA